MGLICLGIESTAHTFSVGIVSGKGEIFGLATDTYLPSSGGLKPGDVVEHHYACFEQVLRAALKEANITLSELNLIAFSQGPGLGPVLRIGAAIARSLALKLKIPIVGVNHCIAHIEIGRLLCQVEDPVTLYVSGGNTIISAFDSSRYQVFGETLDLPIGNMLDMVAREIGIPHPGGPQIEKIAIEGSQYYPFPYIVKGMDLSYSGLFSAIRAKFREKPVNNSCSRSDLIFSLQETAFAMLTEVFERAIAHTEKHSVLLTGGVAANKRLQEMIRYVSDEHNVPFHVVPLRLAGDNGAMIAWTGLLRFQQAGEMTIEQTQILPKWRLDEVTIPWRKDVNQDSVKPVGKMSLTPDNLEFVLSHLPNISGDLLWKGAEAVILDTTWAEESAITKYRLPKLYRIKALDDEIRTRRTLLEARILISLHEHGFPVPLVYEVDPIQGIIIMQKIPGLRLKDSLASLSVAIQNTIFHNIGTWIAKMHQTLHVHGDLTTSNIIYTPSGKLFFIDFGLSTRDVGIEDQAMDLHLFKRVLLSTHGSLYPRIYDHFLQGYQIERGTEGLDIINRITAIELRGRYIPKEKRRKKKIS